MTRYLAIFETVRGDKFVIEYNPLEGGGIEVLGVDYIPRPRSPWEERVNRRRRGIVLTVDEEHAEAMLPTTRLEQMNLFEC